MWADPRSLATVKTLLLEPRLPWRSRQALAKWHQHVARLAADHRVLATPPRLTGREPADFEIHLLLGKRHVGMSLWAIKSLLHWAGKAYSVVLHDDGSLTWADCETLRQHLIDVRIISRAEGDYRMMEKLAAFPHARAYRFGHLGSGDLSRPASVFALKLLDFSLLSYATKILVLDSDVLFFQRPQAIIDWIDDAADRDSLYCYEWYQPIRNLRDKIIRFERKPEAPTGFNSGLVCLERAAFDLPALNAWLGEHRSWADTVYTFEQRAYNHLIQRTAHHRPLPDTYSFNYNGPECVATHFGIKSLFFSNLHRVRRALTAAAAH